MNLSNLITKIKVKCGLYVIALPFDNPDEFITKIIQDITLRTFSIYYPYYQQIRFNLNDLEVVEEIANHKTYLLPDVFKEQEIILIRDVKYEESLISDTAIPMVHADYINQAIYASAELNMLNRIIPKMTFDFEPPRKVTIYNSLASTNMVFDIGLTHPKNLITIPPIMEETFYELAILDVEDALYQTLKHYDGISTAYGNIQLKLDEWQQAASERKSLLEKWDSIYHLDITPFEYA